jgi:hypothetical protein
MASCPLADDRARRLATLGGRDGGGLVRFDMDRLVESGERKDIAIVVGKATSVKLLILA